MWVTTVPKEHSHEHQQRNQKRPDTSVHRPEGVLAANKSVTHENCVRGKQATLKLVIRGRTYTVIVALILIYFNIKGVSFWNAKLRSVE